MSRNPLTTIWLALSSWRLQCKQYANMFAKSINTRFTAPTCLRQDWTTTRLINPTANEMSGHVDVAKYMSAPTVDRSGNDNVLLLFFGSSFRSRVVQSSGCLLCVLPRNHTSQLLHVYTVSVVNCSLIHCDRSRHQDTASLVRDPWCHISYLANWIANYSALLLLLLPIDRRHELATDKRIHPSNVQINTAMYVHA